VKFIMASPADVDAPLLLGVRFSCTPLLGVDEAMPAGDATLRGDDVCRSVAAVDMEGIGALSARLNCGILLGALSGLVKEPVLKDVLRTLPASLLSSPSSSKMPRVLHGKFRTKALASSATRGAVPSSGSSTQISCLVS
jgi:hypothetical protein